MSRIEELENQVTALDSEELRAFREWFARYDAEAWDKQIENDAKSGSLSRLAQRALGDHASGRSTEL